MSSVVTIHSWDNHIVVGVAVILDESAASVVACKLDSVGVDGLHGGKESLSVVDNHSRVLVVGSGGDFRVDVVTDLNIATDNGQVNIVSLVTLLSGLLGSMDLARGWALLVSGCERA